MTNQRYTIEELKPFIEQAIKDTALVVNNSTKKENSGLYTELRKDLAKLDVLIEKFDNHQAQDTEWKERAEPVIRMGENVAGFGKVTLYLFGFLIALGGAVAIVKGWVKM